MAAVKTRLSRHYVYARFDPNKLDFDLAEATLHKVALMADPAEEPQDEDWHEAIVVTATSGDGGAPHSLWEKAGQIPSLAVLVGPTRDDDVTGNVDKAAGRYLLWSDVKPPGSHERLTDWHGEVIITTGQGA